MNPKLTIENSLNESLKLHNKLIENPTFINVINDVAQKAAQCLKNKGKLFFAGNGGSFADAQHLAAEFIGTMGKKRESFPAVAIGTNLSTLTAITNDYCYEDVFSRELSAIGNKQDFIFLLSTSGNSKSLVQLVQIIKEKEMEVFALLGKTGGVLSSLVPNLIVPSARTERIQEVHILLGHIICELIEIEMMNSTSEF